MEAKHKTDQSAEGRNVVGRILKFLVPVAVSGMLVMWLFHKVSVRQVIDIVRNGVDYGFIFAMMAITVLSHMIRGIRWGIQLRAAGIPRIPVMAESVSIFGAYALNLVFPCLGEAWRCLYIKRREGCPLATVVGTDLGDRASDGIMILALVALSLFVARPAMDRFLDHYSIGETISSVLSDGMLWLLLAGTVVLLVAADLLFRRTAFVRGVNRSVLRMWEGFKVLFHMKGTALYIVLTFGIWICYYLETYVCFFAFPFTRTLLAPEYGYGLVPGLVVFVFGSCSMGVPSNGGLGPWNVAVMFALSLYGVSDTDGAAYSLVCWSFQAMILVASGLFSVFYIIYDRRRRRVAERSRG
ncbi:MAG: flippase-like domain-containing protein [Muribaculaceae bacterium]|nr:flippase-like domain-containing protein [Muribaculaceae bacterium]